LGKKREKVIGTGWKDQPVPKGLPPGTKWAATLRQRGSLFGTGLSFQPVPMEAQGTD